MQISKATGLYIFPREDKTAGKPGANELSVNLRGNMHQQIPYMHVAKEIQDEATSHRITSRNRWEWLTQVGAENGLDASLNDIIKR